MPEKPKVHRAARAPKRDRRPTAQARGYTSRWQKASKTYLASHPVCAGVLPSGAECLRPAQCVDHVRPHRGDWSLFWDSGNWQPLCLSCHNRKTATEDRKR